MSVDRFIPIDLFPIREKGYTLEWANKTYEYCHLFDSNVNTSAFKTDSDLKSWIQTALTIRQSLMKQGNARGKEVVVNIATQMYGMKMISNDNLSPTCVEDILAIIAKSEWYRENKSIRLNQVYTLMYGILRNGQNDWVYDLEKKNLNHYNVKINKETKDVCSPMYRSCLYQIIILTFGNTNAKRFREAMVRSHGEYLTVRDKISKKLNNTTTVERVSYLSGPAYLVKVKRMDVLFCNNENNKIENMGFDWINRCKVDNLSNNAILEKFKMLLNNNTNVQESPTGKNRNFYCYLKLNLFLKLIFYIVIDLGVDEFSTAKETNPNSRESMI